MYELPSMRFMETYNFIRWAAENWKLLANLYNPQCRQIEEVKEVFLKNSIETIEALKEEAYHLCILMYAIENLPQLSDSIYTAFFKTVIWLMDEKRVKYFEDELLRELKAKLKEKEAFTEE